MKRLEQIFNRIKEESMTERAKRYEIEVGMVSNTQEREDLARYSTFNTNVLTEVIAYIISNIEQRQFNTFFISNFKTIIAADDAEIPNNLQIEDNRKDMFCFSPEKYNVHTQFYYLTPNYCTMDTMLTEYPYPYIKDFIDYVISYRIETNAREISGNELYLLASKFLNERKNKPEPNKSSILDFKEFNFLNRLENPQDIIDIINRCIDAQNAEYDAQEIPWHEHYVDTVQISDEIDRRDINGNRYMYVNSMSGNLLHEPFIIYDFSMQRIGNSPKDFSNILKRFMVEKFGKEYIDALKAKRDIDTEQEIKELSQFLSPSRK